ncbi:hypothetical protein, partial [Pseudomonas viridiflava]|uniref:hypothetical protein n=1 Tax=Pseudomonas viridiflava TaxID=33069 RepID=UPI0019D2A984
MLPGREISAPEHLLARVGLENQDGTANTRFAAFAWRMLAGLSASAFVHFPAWTLATAPTY